MLAVQSKSSRGECTFLVSHFRIQNSEFLSHAALEGADAIEAIGVAGELAALDQFVPDFLFELAAG